MFDRIVEAYELSKKTDLRLQNLLTLPFCEAVMTDICALVHFRVTACLANNNR